MSNALAIVPHAAPSASLALEPTDLDSAYRLAQQVAASRLMGAAARTPESALVIIVTGRELGLTAMQSLRSLHVIEGKPVMSSDLMVALVRRSPLCKAWRLVESTSTVATYETTRAGDDGPTRMSFSIDDAKAAGLAGKQNWKAYPAAMLRARCIAALARAVYPDLLLGVYETDELAPTQQHVPEVRREEPAEVSFAEYQAEPAPSPVDAIRERLAECATLADVDTLSSEARREKLLRHERIALSEAFAARRAELSQPTVAPAEEVA